MSRFLLIGSAAAAILTVAGFANAAPQQAGVAKAETRADLQAAVARQFAKLDTNHDGFVTKAEIDALDGQRETKVKQAENRVEHFDPSRIFARLDGNHDGKVTKIEAEAARNSRVDAKGGKPAKAQATAMGGLFERSDANKDGVVTKAEFDASTSQMRARMEARLEKASMQRPGSRMFQIADTNKDGKVALAEVQQIAGQRFDRLDLNHDGKLTPEERKQARQQMGTAHRPS